MPKDSVPQERFSTVEQNKVRSINYERMKQASERAQQTRPIHVVKPRVGDAEQPASSLQVMQYIADHDLASTDQASGDRAKVTKKLRRYVRATDSKSMTLNYKEQDEPTAYSGMSQHVSSPR